MQSLLWSGDTLAVTGIKNDYVIGEEIHSFPRKHWMHSLGTSIFSFSPGEFISFLNWGVTDAQYHQPAVTSGVNGASFSPHIGLSDAFSICGKDVYGVTDYHPKLKDIEYENEFSPRLFYLERLVKDGKVSLLDLAEVKPPEVASFSVLNSYCVGGKPTLVAHAEHPEKDPRIDIRGAKRRLYLLQLDLATNDVKFTELFDDQTMKPFAVGTERDREMVLPGASDQIVFYDGDDQISSIDPKTGLVKPVAKLVSPNAPKSSLAFVSATEKHLFRLQWRPGGSGGAVDGNYYFQAFDREDGYRLVLDQELSSEGIPDGFGFGGIAVRPSFRP